MSILVERKTFVNRINICKECERFRPKTNRCSVCGCFMNVKAWMHKNIDGKLVTCPHPKGNKWIK